jgi:hypothetical protein
MSGFPRRRERWGKLRVIFDGNAKSAKSQLVRGQELLKTHPPGANGTRFWTPVGLQKGVFDFSLAVSL